MEETHINWKAKRILIIAFSFIWMGFTVLVTHVMTDGIKQQNAAHDTFVPVQARVISSRVATSTTGAGNTRSISYSPDIRYSYTHEGRDYESSSYWLTGETFGRSAAEDIVARYPAGQIAEAFIDPQNPQESVLNRERPETRMIYGLISLSWLVGIGLFIVGLRIRPGNSTHAGRDMASA